MRHKQGPKLKVVYIQYTNPYIYPPIEHSARIFAAHNWEVRFLGIHVEGAADNLRFGCVPNTSVELMQRWGPGIRLKFHFTWFLVWCCWKVWIMKPHLLYVSDPLASPIGMFLALFTDIPIIYHEHDSPQQHSARIIESFVLFCRKHLARKCVACVLPNTNRAAAFATNNKSCKLVLSVMNCPSVEELNGCSASSINRKLKVYYHGSIVPERLPVTVLDALSLVPNVVLTVVGYGTIDRPDYVEYFKSQVACRSLSSRVIYYGVVSPREELLRVCSQQNLGLALVPMCTDEPNLAAMAGASNKVFDYLATGLPILVSDLPDHRRLFVDAGVAKVCDPRDPESIASAFRWFLNNEGEAHQMGMKGKEKVIREWNYEYQFQPVLGLLSASAEGFRRRPMLQSSL